MKTVRKILITSFVGATAFSLFEITIGYIFINVLGLYDPYPRGAEFGFLLEGWYISFFVILLLYILALVMAVRETNQLTYKSNIALALLLAFLFSIFNRWYDIPRDESFWVVWLSPVIFMFVVVVSTKLLVHYRLGKNA